jgi:hypothetical protein
MATRDRADVEGALLGKGFRQVDTHHHRFIYWTSEGKMTGVQTKTSHSHKVIDVSNIGKMARQCRLRVPEFLNLVDCPMSRDDYEAHLRSVKAV